MTGNWLGGWWEADVRAYLTAHLPRRLQHALRVENYRLTTHALLTSSPHRRSAHSHLSKQDTAELARFLRRRCSQVLHQVLEADISLFLELLIDLLRSFTQVVVSAL